MTARPAGQYADVAIIGGGIVGASAAALLAQGGARVILLEREAVAAGASGRNSGVVQHPFDSVLVPLHVASIRVYRRLAETAGGAFPFPDEPHGLLVVAPDRDSLSELARSISAVAPELAPAMLSPEDLAVQEPALAPGVHGCLMATGYPVEPASATHELARAAARAGATVRVGAGAEPIVERGRAVGVRLGGERIDAGAVLVAAGPWSAGALPRAVVPIRPIWGVVVELELAEPPRRVLEEHGAESLTVGGIDSLFSLVTARGRSALGSTFTAQRPDAAAIAPDLIRRGARFVPALADAAPLGVRACARPVSADGRPLIGHVPDVEGLFVCAGHGPWGISTGPGSAELVVRAILGDDAAVPPELAAYRFA